MPSDEPGAQYWTVALVAPPIISSFSSMITSAPDSRAVTAAATPAAPEPTTTTSVSWSHESLPAEPPDDGAHALSAPAPKIPAVPRPAAVMNDLRDIPFPLCCPTIAPHSFERTVMRA